MLDPAVAKVRSFNRLVARRIGALEESYLKRGRPLGEARLIFEIGAGGADLRALRGRLGLDSGYLSRLVASLKAQGLVEAAPSADDARQRRVRLTRKGRAELAAYDELSDALAVSWLERLDAGRRERLVIAVGEVERLLQAAFVEIAPAPAASEEARFCLTAYFRELATRFEEGFAAPDLDEETGEMTPPEGLILIARLDGAPIGCGALKRIDSATAEIKRVWTAPDARGLGVARRVLGALEFAACENGFRTIRLDTNRALKEAQAMYRKAGYREIPRFNDNPYANHWFQKEI